LTGVTEPRTVEAFILGAMAVHQQYDIPANERRTYVVTHIPSGRIIQSGMTQKQARAFAEALDPFDARWLLPANGTTKDLPVEDQRALSAKRRAARISVLELPL
jgi:hypothetical protein